MKRSDEHQKFIMTALEGRDIHTVRSVGQALMLSSPTGIKREDLFCQIADALKEGALQKGDKKKGRPPKNSETGVLLLQCLDDEYFNSKKTPLRSLAGEQKTYELPIESLSQAQFDKSWANKILRGQRILLYSISPQSIRAGLNMVVKHIAKNDKISVKTIVGDIAPEQVAAYTEEISGDVFATNFSMPTELQSTKITHEIKSFFETDGHLVLMTDDIDRLAGVCTNNLFNLEDAVRVICGLAVKIADKSVTLICGTSNEEFLHKFSRLFNQVNKI